MDQSSSTTPSSSVEWSVKVTTSRAPGAAGAKLNAACGGWLAVTSIEWLTLSVAPPSSVTVSLTLKVPAVKKRWLGFRRLENCPSPKSQDQETTRPSESV